MADLLLELFSEEIPARMQLDAQDHLAATLEAKLKDISPKLSLVAFSTPRRIAVWVKDLPVEQAASETEIKGPKLGAPDAAIQGFLKKNNLVQADLTERDGVYFAVLKKEGRQTADALKTIIEDMLHAFPWPKSMRWGSGEQAWVRPLHSILCLFDGKVIPVSFAGIKAGNITRGHRFLAPVALTVSNAGDYEATLEKTRVYPNREKRKANILEQLQKAADSAKLVLKKDDGLLSEVTGLVEWPVVLTGSIDAKYMDLPKEVLVTEMRAHQKYFALENADGTLSDKFLITSNMVSTDQGQAIIAGNERVLRARLADGRFFWDMDRKKPLTEWAQGLKAVTFHAKLGTVADKVDRIEKRALQLAPYAKADTKLVAQAARLCKADLVTGMVGEFPELQGVMGRYYAKAQGENESVYDAIRDHYKPQGPTDSVPTNAVSACVALADKLDTLVSMFAIGEKPTGSKDPFALRRAALGIIRIILDNELRLPLKTLFVVQNAPSIALHKAHDKLAKQTEASLKEKHQVGKYVVVNESASEDICDVVPENLAEILYDFFVDRLKVQLKEKGIRHDVINAVIANGDDDFVRVVKRAKALQNFLGSEDGANLLTGYKRASNILVIEEKKDNQRYPGGVELLLLQEIAEKALFEKMCDLDIPLEKALQNEIYDQAGTLLATLRPYVDHFFDSILVNAENREVRSNRLNLLAQIKRRLDSIANFALIEGESKEHKKAA